MDRFSQQPPSGLVAAGYKVNEEEGLNPLEENGSVENI
jgi:hypothetical protein